MDRVGEVLELPYLSLREMDMDADHEHGTLLLKKRMLVTEVDVLHCEVWNIRRTSLSWPRIVPV